MDEIRINKSDLELFEEINRIKYWRRIRLIKLSIAIGLVLSIFWFGWVNYVHANEYRLYQQEYGNNWACYICGYENLRSCSCIYGVKNIDSEYKENLANSNIEECESYYNESTLSKFNISNFSIPLY